MDELTYVRMTGAGNNFCVLDARGKALDLEGLAIELCKKHGTDGFMALDRSEKCDFRLHFYNADGSRGEMCGNGARCICRFAYDLGIAGTHMTVETDAGVVEGWRLEENFYRVKLNNPGVVDLLRKQDTAYIELGCPGIPHAVREVPGLCWSMRDSLRPLGRALRYDKAFPKGANVNFYTWLSPHTIRILTYERGVEDFTLACGTGSGSVAAVLYLAGQLPGKHLSVENPGGTLKVTLEAQGQTITALYLEGKAEYENAPRPYERRKR